MCLKPKWIYKKGNYKENNYRGLKGDFYELGTFAKCGTCSQCLADKANNWVVRNWYEEKAHTKKCFLTLTYAESPIILVRKDLQNFMKRFRQYLDYYENGTKIRIFYAGEYGTVRNRPHYHIIVYGWEDTNAKYLCINDKKQIVLQSDIIQKIWGLGRTSYQNFSTKEAPYISLYNTNKETFKKAYKINRQKLKKLEDYAKTNARLNDAIRKNMLEEINAARRALEDEKVKYYMIKEFNGWSTALGWEEFEKAYYTSEKYVFTEYIEDCEYLTPSPWLKKLANAGDIQAAIELKNREEQADKETNEEVARMKAEIRESMKKKTEIFEWTDKKTEVELTL